MVDDIVADQEGRPRRHSQPPPRSASASPEQLQPRRRVRNRDRYKAKKAAEAKAKKAAEEPASAPVPGTKATDTTAPPLSPHPTPAVATGPKASSSSDSDAELFRLLKARQTKHDNAPKQQDEQRHPLPAPTPPSPPQQQQRRSTERPSSSPSPSAELWSQWRDLSVQMASSTIANVFNEFHDSMAKVNGGLIAQVQTLNAQLAEQKAFYEAQLGAACPEVAAALAAAPHRQGQQQFAAPTLPAPASQNRGPQKGAHPPPSPPPPQRRQQVQETEEPRTLHVTPPTAISSRLRAGIDKLQSILLDPHATAEQDLEVEKAETTVAAEEEHHHDDDDDRNEDDRIPEPSGWDETPDSRFESEVCNIDKIPIHTMTKEVFETVYEGRRPVILTNIKTSADVARATTRETLLKNYGAQQVSLMNPNALSGKPGGTTSMLLSDYIQARMAPMEETWARNVSSMFLPNTMQPPRGIMENYCPPWEFQNHDLCRGGMTPGSTRPEAEMILLRSFQEYDADGSGFLESRSMEEAGRVAGLGNPCGISDPSLARYMENNSFIGETVAGMMELETLFNDLGLPEGRARSTIMAKLDKDQDGKISESEFSPGCQTVLQILLKSSPNSRRIQPRVSRPKFAPNKKCAQMSFQTTLALGRRGSGLAFHLHEDGFNELFHGRKRWFFYSPYKTPHFNPRRTQQDWLLNVYPTLEKDEMPDECIVSAGQAIYFPAGWHHAVLNLEQNVFTSAFHGTTNIYPDKNTLVDRLEFGQYTYDPPPGAPMPDVHGEIANKNPNAESSFGGRDDDRPPLETDGGIVLQTFLKQFPNSFEANDFQGDVHMHFKERAKAVPFYMKVIQLNPLYGKAYTKLADALTFLGLGENAEVLYQTADSLDAKGDRGQFRDA